MQSQTGRTESTKKGILNTSFSGLEGHRKRLSYSVEELVCLTFHAGRFQAGSRFSFRGKKRSADRRRLMPKLCQLSLGLAPTSGCDALLQWHILRSVLNALGPKSQRQPMKSYSGGNKVGLSSVSRGTNSHEPTAIHDLLPTCAHATTAQPVASETDMAEACGSRTHHSTREGPNRRL